MELTVLGASGSYGAPAGGACSGYLVRAADASIWVDCGNGTLANLQRHLPPQDLSAVVITHRHPDHSVDIFGLHVMMKYGLKRQGLPVFAAPEVADTLAPLVDGWDDTFEWHLVDGGDRVTVGGCRLGFSRTSHTVPCLAVEAAAGGKRLVYTSDTGPEWLLAEAFEPGADLVLSEATSQDSLPMPGVHLTAREAGEGARAAAARRLMLTHLWPSADPQVSVVQGSEGFGAPVLLAAPHERVRI